jgi:hypothetical protein
MAFMVLQILILVQLLLSSVRDEDAMKTGKGFGGTCPLVPLCA